MVVQSPEYNCSPYQLWYGKPPDVSHIRRFGERCIMWVPLEKRQHGDKVVDPAGIPGRYVGVPSHNIRGHLVYRPDTKRIVIATSVRFDNVSSNRVPEHAPTRGTKSEFDPRVDPNNSEGSGQKADAHEQDMNDASQLDKNAPAKPNQDKKSTIQTQDHHDRGPKNNVKSRPKGKTRDTQTAGPRTRSQNKGSEELKKQTPTQSSESDDEQEDDDDAPVDMGDGWSEMYYVTKRGGESYEDIAEKVGVHVHMLINKNYRKGDRRKHRPTTKLRKGTTLWVPDGYWERPENVKPLALIARESGSECAWALHAIENDDVVHGCGLRIADLAAKQTRTYRDGSDARWRKAARIYQKAKRQMYARLVKELPNTRASEVPTPKNYKEAVNDPDFHQFWAEAIAKEVTNMKDHQVFEWVRREDLPRDNKPIDYTWAFRAKPNNDGLIDKFKARLCARGFREIFGIHYTETHAPVTTLTAFRGCVADAAFRGWLYDVFDIGSAYLRTLLTDLITFLPIDGFKPPDSRPGWLMRARKAIYGLKQAGRSWGQDLHKILTSLGMKRASSEPCLYVRERNGKIIKLVTHVDDCFCTFNDREEYNEFKARLEEVLRKMSNSDKPVLSSQDDNDRYLGIVIQRAELANQTPTQVSESKNGSKGLESPTLTLVHGNKSRQYGTPAMRRSGVVYRLHQKQYIIDILGYFDMLECEPAPTPFSTKMISAEDNAGDDEAQIRFMKDKNMRKLVGMLLHLARCTRPDIMSAVAILARYQVDPGKRHWHWGMRILRYLAGTLDYAITYGKLNDPDEGHVEYTPFSMYHDSDWAGDKDKRRSRTGWISMSYGGPINWCSQLQKCTAQSSGEAEYIAASEAAKETVWSARLMRDLGYTQEQLHACQYSKTLSPDRYKSADYQTKLIRNEQEKAGKRPIVQYCDSTTAISNTINTGADHKKMKHVDVRYHYVRTLVHQGTIKVCKVPTALNVADILTKPTKIETFVRHCKTIMECGQGAKTAAE